MIGAPIRGAPAAKRWRRNAVMSLWNLAQNGRDAPTVGSAGMTAYDAGPLLARCIARFSAR